MSDSLTIFGTDYTGVAGIKAKGTGNGTLTYVRPTGTKSITANGTGIDVASYASVDVAVPTGGGTDWPVFTASSDGTATCNKTYAECKALGTGSPALAVTPYSEFIGQEYKFDRGFIVYVFFAQGVPHIGLNYHEDGTIELLNKAPSVTQLDVTSNGTYTSNTNMVWDSVTVNAPSSTPSLQSKTVTPTEQQQTVSPDSGYDGLSSVTVGAISSTYVGSGVTQRTSSDLTASGATVTVPAGHYAQQASKAVASGTEGTPTATKGNVANHAVTVTPSVTNTTGYITGGTHSGTGVTVAASELVSGTKAITGAGTTDVTEYASASVASGGATASATKGSVSNHSVTVTPKVTRTAGWVSAGTSNGTAVTVSASELVSGNLALTDNTASTDVTNYATVSVNIPFVTYHTSSSAPTSSQGSDGDIWLVTS